MEEKTYTQKVHFKIIIEGDYSCSNLLEEDLYKEPTDAHDSVLDFVGDQIIDYFYNANIILDDLRTIEEN